MMNLDQSIFDGFSYVNGDYYLEDFDEKQQLQSTDQQSPTAVLATAADLLPMSIDTEPTLITNDD